MTGKNKIGAYMTTPNLKDLDFIKELVETGQVTPVIDRCYSLFELPQAIRYLETKHARGKVVISVEQESLVS